MVARLERQAIAAAAGTTVDPETLVNASRDALDQWLGYPADVEPEPQTDEGRLLKILGVA